MHRVLNVKALVGLMQDVAGVRDHEHECDLLLRRHAGARSRHVPHQILVCEEQPPGRGPGDLQEGSLHLQNYSHSSGIYSIWKYSQFIYNYLLLAHCIIFQFQMKYATDSFIGTPAT